MMFMGDEYGHTRYGNNNSYGHDAAINNFQWNQVLWTDTHTHVFFLFFFSCFLQYVITNKYITSVES